MSNRCCMRGVSFHWAFMHKRGTQTPSRAPPIRAVGTPCALPFGRWGLWGPYRFVQKKRSGGDLGSNRPSSPRNLESKSFSRSLDRFQSIWIDSETLIFRRFEPGSLSTFFRKSDLENPNLEPENRKLVSEKIDFGPRIIDVF